MLRGDHLLLGLAVLLSHGCVSNVFRSHRDADILTVTTPRYVPSVTELIDAGPDPTIKPSAVMDLTKRTDAPMGLHDVLRLAMSTSKVVRVDVGDGVAASEATFFDIQAGEAGVLESLAEFDTEFQTELQSRIINRPPDSVFGPGLIQPEERDELQFNFGWTKKTVLGGRTSVLFNPDPSYLFIPGSSGFNPRHISELEFSIVQPLLRDAGRAVNLVPIEVSQIDWQRSAWDFKKSLLESVRDIVEAYWDLQAAIVAAEAVKEILPLVKEIVRIQEEAFRAEWVTAGEVAKARAQYYGFRRDYEEEKSNVHAAELRLRDLIGLRPTDNRRFVPTTKPLKDEYPVSPYQAYQVAIENQPDIVRRRLAVRVRMLERRLARNGLRPRLDFNATYRRNGLDDDLGDSLNQMFTDDFRDWELGASFVVPLGRREAAAQLRAAELNLVKEQNLLEQEIFSVNHRIQDTIRDMVYSYRQYTEAVKSLDAADGWVRGAKLRYENPNVEVGGNDVLVQNLNEYLNSLRFRTAVATEKAQLIADYNTALIQIEEEKGTLLSFFGIQLATDPCRGAARLPSPVTPANLGSANTDAVADPPSADDSTDKRPAEMRDELPAQLPDAADREAGAARDIQASQLWRLPPPQVEDDPQTAVFPRLGDPAKLW